MSKWSQRAHKIESFKVMDLLKRAKALDAEGFDVVHMEAGEPDFPTALPIKEAAMAAIFRKKRPTLLTLAIVPVRKKSLA
jgi:aspartate/methionine/tyrosine aminotransferase